MASTAPQTAKNVVAVRRLWPPGFARTHLCAHPAAAVGHAVPSRSHIQYAFRGRISPGQRGPGRRSVVRCPGNRSSRQKPPAQKNPPRRICLARLSEFQRRGFYLAFLAECPPDSSGSGGGRQEAAHQDSAELCARLWTNPREAHPVFLPARSRSYCFRQPCAALIPMLEQAGLSKELLLNNGATFDLPRSGSTPPGDFQAPWLRAQAGS